MSQLRPIILLGHSGKKEFLQNISESLRHSLRSYSKEINDVLPVPIDPKFFTDGSPNVSLQDSIRGSHVYVVTDPYSLESNNHSINDSYMFHRGLVETARTFGAKTVNSIFTTMPYARDDKYEQVGTKNEKKRKPNMVQMAIRDCIGDGNNNVITFDLHNDSSFAISSNLATKFIDLPIGWMISKVIKEQGLGTDNLILSGCDQGSDKKIEAIARDLQIEQLGVRKFRDYSKPQSVSQIAIYGDVTGKDIIIYDDIMDTGGTFAKTIETIADMKPRSIHGVISHGLFYKDAMDKLEKLHLEAKLTSFSVSNSVERIELRPWINNIDTSMLFANTIASIAQDRAIEYNAG